MPTLQPNTHPGPDEFPFRGTKAGEPYQAAYECFDKAVAHFDEKRFAEAADSFREALRLKLPAPEYLAANAQLALSLLVLRRPDEALQVYRSVLASKEIKNMAQPQEPFLLRRMAETYAFIRSTLKSSLAADLPYKEKEERGNLIIDAECGRDVAEMLYLTSGIPRVERWSYAVRKLLRRR